MKEGLSRNADAEQDDLVSSLARVSVRPPLATPPATIVSPPVSASGNPDVAVANSTALTDRRSRKEGLSRNVDAEQDDLGSSLGQVSARPPPANPPATITLPRISASGNPEVAVASNALTGRRSRKEGLSRKADAEQDELVSSLARESMRPPLATSPATMVVPRISAYVSGRPAVAVAGKAVVIGEAIAKAEHIADNFSSTSEYLKVSQGFTRDVCACSTETCFL